MIIVMGTEKNNVGLQAKAKDTAGCVRKTRGLKKVKCQKVMLGSTGGVTDRSLE